MSHATFYALFTAKEDCACAAYDRFIEVVWREAAFAGVATSTTWRGFMQASLDGYFDVLAADPLVAKGFHLEMQAIGPEAGQRQARALQGFAVGRMRAEQRLREVDPLLKERPFSVHLGSVHVVRALAREALEASPNPDFNPLRSELVDWFVASWYGEEPVDAVASAEQVEA